MVSIGQELNIKFGYSDHTLGIEVSIAAAAMGATCIEKHFTLDKNMEGPDHKASLEPDQLKEMVRAIRNIEIALGDGEKKLSKSELVNMQVARKSIVAKTDIKIGDAFSETNLTTKRPGTGISPMKWDQILNKKSTTNYNKDDIIQGKELIED